MSEDDSSTRINLQDNPGKMAEAQGSNENATEDKKGGATTQEGEQSSKDGGSWMSKPENLGNSAGDKVQSALSPVGNTAGKGFAAVAGPVGGIVDPLVGGVMKAGKGFGEQAGVGYGNAEGGPAKQAEREGERMKEPYGGKEQTGENPLGL